MDCPPLAGYQLPHGSTAKTLGTPIPVTADVKVLCAESFLLLHHLDIWVAIQARE